MNNVAIVAQVLPKSVRYKIHISSPLLSQIAIGSRVVAELGLFLGAFTICTVAEIQITICSIGLPW